MKNPPGTDHGRFFLLDLDGERFVLEQGYWVKFEVRRVRESRHIPHGIRYSLTLHDRANQRILGYDNAHTISSDSRTGKADMRDHKHLGRSVENYKYTSAFTLLKDFFQDVNRVIGRAKDLDT